MKVCPEASKNELFNLYGYGFLLKKVVPVTNRGHRRCSDRSDGERAVGNSSTTKKKLAAATPGLFHTCILI